MAELKNVLKGAALLTVALCAVACGTKGGTNDPTSNSSQGGNNPISGISGNPSSQAPVSSY